MSVTERSSATRSSFQIPVPGENLLLAVIVLAFLVLHVLAGTMLWNTFSAATADSQAPTQTLSAPYD